LQLLYRSGQAGGWACRRGAHAIPAEIRENTIVISTSDHGEMGTAHGELRQKAFQVYEEIVNIPLIIHNPVLFPTTQETDADAGLIDLMPTLTTLAEVPSRAAYSFYGTLTTLDEPVAPPVELTNSEAFRADDLLNQVYMPYITVNGSFITAPIVIG
jgi:arylsulfatase A-like enzyme